MSVYYRVYSATADAVGTGTNATYLTARAGTAATVSTDTGNFVGQRLSAGNYSCYQIFYQFDISAIPAGGTSYIGVYCTVYSAGADGDTLEFRQVGSIANKIAGASISANTLLGSVAYSSTWASTYQKFALTGDPTRSATSNIMLNCTREVAATVPTVNEYAALTMADTAGTSRDPFIQIEFVPAWKFIAVSSVVTISAGTTHTLNEPTGAAQGDLLVACISSRIASTTSISLPSAEWTLVSEQKTNNTLTTTSAVSSGMMAYCIRGASAPSYIFTHPTTPSVAMGRVIAYRNVDQGAPKDTQTSFTTAVNTTAVTGAGLTTTQDDDLIVAMFAGGQEADVTVFDAATDPATDSGTFANQNNDPFPGIWTERADSITTTGADTSLSIFDAVKTTAGATGDLSCTASLGAGHVVIAGAFCLAPPSHMTLVNVSFAVMRAASW